MMVRSFLAIFRVPLKKLTRYPEATFYREGLANFTEQQFADAGYDASVYKNYQEISYDETSHVDTITQVLQGTVLPSLSRYITY